MGNNAVPCVIKCFLSASGNSIRKCLSATLRAADFVYRGMLSRRCLARRWQTLCARFFRNPSEILHPIPLIDAGDTRAMREIGVQCSRG